MLIEAGSSEGREQGWGGEGSLGLGGAQARVGGGRPKAGCRGGGLGRSGVGRRSGVPKEG